MDPSRRLIRSLKLFPRSLAPPALQVGGNTVIVPSETTRRAYYPGSKAYVDFKHHFSDNNLLKWNSTVWGEYVQAVALQRMGRNTLFVEIIPSNGLERSDKIIGFLAWLLAQGGLLLSFPAFLLLFLVTELLGVCFELVGFRVLVETEVTLTDRFALAKVVDECNVGKNLEATLDEDSAFW